MTAKMGRYRYWGDQKPDTTRPLLTFSRPADAVPAKQQTAAADQPKSTGTLRIYGPIDSWGGFWGVSAKEVAQALDMLGDVDSIVVRVNSPGGESSEGRAIMNLLRAHSATCTAVVDGGAYSAASYIAVGCDETVMGPGTTMMIHDTSTFVYGNADALRKVAGVLDTLSDSGAELYAEVAGGTVAEWRERQKAETWYTAAEAVAAGLADRVGVVPDAGVVETAGDNGPEPAPADAEDRARATYDLSLFDRAPQGAPHDPPAASAGGSTHPTEGGTAVAFSDEQITDMRRKLGIAEDADEATILAALSEALDERAEPTPADSGTAVPEGHVVIPEARLRDLEEGAKAGTAAAKELRDKEREAFLDANRAKYAPANRDAWAKEFDRDPEGTRKHFATAPDLVPVSEIGQAETDANSADVLDGVDPANLDSFLSGMGLTKEDLRG